MPILNLKISGKRSSETIQSIVNHLTDVTQNELNKKPEVTAICISFIDCEHWFVNKINLNEQNLNSFYLDIKITDSTNLKQEKERYIKSVFEFMEKELGKLHEKSYIYVEEVKADSYGFGAKTQEFRYISER